MNASSFNVGCLAGMKVQHYAFYVLEGGDGGVWQTTACIQNIRLQISVLKRLSEQKAIQFESNKACLDVILNSMGICVNLVYTLLLVLQLHGKVVWPIQHRLEEQR